MGSRIHDSDIADVFAAFDVDRDDVISEKDMASFIKHEGQADLKSCGSSALKACCSS